MKTSGVFWTAFCAIAVGLSAVTFAQRVSQPDWKAVEPEALRYYQSLIQFDTSATERKESEYLKQVLDQNGIPAQILFKDPERPNVLARLKGSGKKRPLLLLGHLDTVTVDASKWKFPPFSATRDGGYVYGRGAIDDKDNLTGALMAVLLLKRLNFALDRDVILLAESGEEGASNLGIGYMMAEHYPEIEAEYCIAEGGDTIRERGEVRYATVQVTEKVVRGGRVRLTEASLKVMEVGEVSRPWLLEAAAGPLKPASFQFVFADGVEPPFADGSFDSVVTPWFIDQVPRDLPAFFARLARLLRPGGRWLNQGPLVYPEQTPFAQRFSRGELFELAASAGFAIPASALVRTERQPAVWVVDPRTETVALRTVELVRHDAGHVVVGQGLEPGEVLVTAGVQALRPGQKVRLLGVAR